MLICADLTDKNHNNTVFLSKNDQKSALLTIPSAAEESDASHPEQSVKSL